MVRGWKIPHIVKGMLSWVPLLTAWRLRRGSTGGSDSARYCYSVWLRHLVTLDQHGFTVKGAQIGELGPGDSIGVGLAALISGGARYVGLDIVPFSLKADLETIFQELIQLYSRRASIPDHDEFPRVRPRLDSYEFPDYLVDWTNFAKRVEEVRNELRVEVNPVGNKRVCYRAPWTVQTEIDADSLDLIFSQAVLEHVDAVDQTYQAMYAWLKPGGYASHIIDFSAHYLSPFWNGHWAYSDWEWKLVRGRREFLINRDPLSTHLASVKRAGFEILLLKRDHGSRGLETRALAQRFQILDEEDLETRGALLILRKPRI